MTVNPIITGVPLLAEPASTGAALPVKAADELAAAQFNQVMSAASPPVAAESPSSAIASTAISPAAANADSPADLAPAPLGETILNGLQNLSTEYQKQVAALNQALQSTNEINVSDMLRAQSALIQVTLHHELIGKVATDATYYVDELVKLQ